MERKDIMENPKAWTVQKVNIITLGSLEKILDQISTMSHEWSYDIDDDYCHITYTDVNEFESCTFAFPIIGKLGDDELEMLTIIDGMVAETIKNIEREGNDDESGEPYIYINDELDWNTCMDPVFIGIDKALRHVINANPNVNGES
jgi:hypothetical protein